MCQVLDYILSNAHLAEENLLQAERGEERGRGPSRSCHLVIRPEWWSPRRQIALRKLALPLSSLQIRNQAREFLVTAVDLRHPADAPRECQVPGSSRVSIGRR